MKFCTSIGLIVFLLSSCQTTKVDIVEESSSPEGFAAFEKELEEKDWNDPRSLIRLATVKFFNKKPTESEALLGRALLLYMESSEEDFPNVSLTLFFLALSKAEQGKFQEAMPLFERNMSILEGVYGPNHPCLVPILTPMSVISKELGQMTRAKKLTNRVNSIQGQCENAWGS